METGAYYLHAAIDHLVANNLFHASTEAAAHNIRAMPDERPFPGCGTLFLGLRIGQQLPGKRVLPGMDYTCELIVSVTLRTTTASYIDVGSEFYARRDGQISFQESLQHVCGRIVSLLHQNNDYHQRIQDLICANEGESAPPATGLLRFKGSLPQIRIVDYSHFTEHTENTGTRSDSGLLDILTFGDGERLT